MGLSRNVICTSAHVHFLLLKVFGSYTLVYDLSNQMHFIIFLIPLDSSHMLLLQICSGIIIVTDLVLCFF